MKKRSAFSLLEISIVIMVTMILAVGVMQGRSIVAKAKLTAAKTQTTQSPVPNINDLVGWWETTSERSFDISEATDSSTVSTWYDINPQGLAGANATQSSNAYRPTYKINADGGLPMLKFTSSVPNYLSLPDGTVPYENNYYTILIVSKTSCSSCTGQILYSGTEANNQSNSFYYNSTSIQNSWYGDSVTASAGTTNLHIFSFTYNNGSGRTIYVDGTQTTTNSNTSRNSTSANNMIGAKPGISQALDGYIGEIIIYKRYLKTEERKSVEKYLSRKWGVAVS